MAICMRERLWMRVLTQAPLYLQNDLMRVLTKDDRGGHDGMMI